MKEINFAKFQKKALYIAGFYIASLLLVIFIKQFNLSIDFTGGVVIEFSSEGENVTVEQTRNLLKSIEIKDFSVTNSKEIIILKAGVSSGQNSVSMVDIIKSSIINTFTKSDVEFLKIDFVSPQIGRELIFKAIIAVVASLSAVLVYVSIRFEIGYSIGAIIALAHDVIFTLGFIALFGLPFDVSTIAAILTVVGYSINDSVVIFDRIREYFKTKPELSTHETINLSLNSTLTRTLITSFTTLIAILAIIIVGGEILRPFALIIFVGILVGTLSSIFIAPSLLYLKSNIRHPA